MHIERETFGDFFVPPIGARRDTCRCFQLPIHFLLLPPGVRVVLLEVGRRVELTMPPNLALVRLIWITTTQEIFDINYGIALKEGATFVHELPLLCSIAKYACSLL